MTLAGAGATCATNDDCDGIVCDQALGRCLSSSDTRIGTNGSGHYEEAVGGYRTAVNFSCGASSAPCGECTVTGVNAAVGNCRCANDNRTQCDEPFVADADDCGGNVCNCYLGPLTPVVPAGLGLCLLNQLAADVSGTVNVDTGARVVSADTKSRVFLGGAVSEPCPHCSGDPVADDGIKGGNCIGGANDALACDAHAMHYALPTPSGSGYSLDCFPQIFNEVTGQGILTSPTLSTDADSLSAELSGAFTMNHCSECTNDSTVGCASNADCTGGTCGEGGFATPNGCTDGACTDNGDGTGFCAADILSFCDGTVRANGTGLFACNVNSDCSAQSAGDCTISQNRRCFPDPITTQGVADPEHPVLQSIFCVPPASVLSLNAAVGLPGPSRVVQQANTTVYCDSSLTQRYTPGVGGCP